MHPTILRIYLTLCATFSNYRVQYENCPNRWTFHPAALVKVVSFRVGDLVTIINDAQKVQQLQKGHGEWIDIMRYVSSKMGIN